MSRLTEEIQMEVENRGYKYVHHLSNGGLVYVRDVYKNTFPIFEETVIKWIDESQGE